MLLGVEITVQVGSSRLCGSCKKKGGIMWATDYLDGWVREVSCLDRLHMREVDEQCVEVGSLAQCLVDAGAVPDYVHEDVATAVIDEVGSEWCNPRTGRFWRRAQDCIKAKCSQAWDMPGARRMGIRIDNGSIPGEAIGPFADVRSWADYSSVLRDAVGRMAGNAGVIASKAYYITGALDTYKLGRIFGLNRTSCWWSSHRQSLETFCLHGGYQIRGMWSPDVIRCVGVEDVGLGSWGMRLPELTGGGANSFGVRVVAMPLINGVVGFLNGYKNKLHVDFDFTADRRHYYDEDRETSPLHQVVNDVVRMSGSAGQDWVTRTICVREDYDNPMFINSDKVVLLGGVEEVGQLDRLLRHGQGMDNKSLCDVANPKSDFIFYGGCSERHGHVQRWHSWPEALDFRARTWDDDDNVEDDDGDMEDE